MNYPEKVRFGKHYYKNENGDWKYMNRTATEDEYRDSAHDVFGALKIWLVMITVICGSIYLFVLRPEIGHALNSNPVLNNPAIIGLSVALAVVFGALLILIMLVALIIFLKEAIPAFKRDVLGIERDE